MTLRRIAAHGAVLLCLTLLPLTGFAADEEAPLKARAELSFVNTSGNTNTQTVVARLEAKKEGLVNRYYANGNFLRVEDSGTESSNKLKLEGRWERVLTRRAFGLVTAGWLRDRFSGYDMRAWGGPGVGYDIIKSGAHTLKASATLLWYHDEFSTGADASERYLSARAGADYAWKVRENLSFAQTLDYNTSLKETDRYFIDSITSVEVKVNGRVSLGVNYTVNFQNRPPAPDLRHTDTALLTALIIDF